MTSSRAFTLNKLQGIAAASCLLAIVVIALFVLRATEHPGHAVIRSLPVESPERPATSPLSERHHADFARLVNNLGRRVRWKEKDAAWLRTMIAEPWADAPQPGGDDMDAFEDWMERDFALSIVTTRLRNGVDTDEETLRTFVEAVRAMLNHPQAWVRKNAAAAAANAMLIEIPEFRDRVERLAEQDPAPEVRRVARLKLDQHDGRPVDLLLEPFEPCVDCP